MIELARTDPRWGRWINPAYIARAHEFFERHGGKAIVLGRFMPIVRTFVPFVAGRRGDVVPGLRALQRHRRAWPGWASVWAPATSSATCRSSRTTSRSSPSASCRVAAADGVRVSEASPRPHRLNFRPSSTTRSAIRVAPPRSLGRPPPRPTPHRPCSPSHRAPRTPAARMGAIRGASPRARPSGRASS